MVEVVMKKVLIYCVFCLVCVEKGIINKIVFIIINRKKFKIIVWIGEIYNFFLIWCFIFFFFIIFLLIKNNING